MMRSYLDKKLHLKNIIPGEPFRDDHALCAVFVCDVVYQDESRTIETLPSVKFVLWWQEWPAVAAAQYANSSKAAYDDLMVGIREKFQAEVEGLYEKLTDEMGYVEEDADIIMGDVIDRLNKL